MSNEESGKVNCDGCGSELPYTAEDEKAFIKEFLSLVNKANEKQMMQFIASLCAATYIKLSMDVGKYTRTQVLLDMAMRLEDDESGRNPIPAVVMVIPNEGTNAH